MLDDAIVAFLDAVTEREFDEPLLALLRADGFEDIHFVHGAAEFGKDVIAKRGGRQWAFQSKAGNLNLGEWRQVRLQLDELQRNTLAHPSFDTTLTRECVLVCTGRLVGNAAIEAQNYTEQCRARGEPGIEVWDRDRLVEKLASSPNAVLRGSTDGELLSMLGDTAQRTVSMDRVTEFSVRWTSWDHARLATVGVVELGLIAERLADIDRVDLACHLSLALVRGAWAADGDDVAAAVVADAAGNIFEVHAARLLAACDESVLGPRGDLLRGVGPANWVTYPVRAQRVGEMLGLLALRWRAAGDEREASAVEALAELVTNHPGAAHPIGDRYAACVVPSALALAASHGDLADELLRSTARWLGDRYEPPAVGLPDIDASEDEEVIRLLGVPFVEMPRRAESYLAAVLLDLCVALESSATYEDIYNDVAAVGALPTLVVTDDERGQFLRPGQGTHLVTNVPYAESWSADGSSAAPHHSVALEDFKLGRLNRLWDQLACQAVLRDRHQVAVLVASASLPATA